MINLDSRTKSKLLWVATALAPVLVVQGVRTVFGTSGEPASASAAPTSAAGAPAVIEAERALTPPQKAAQAWLDSRTGDSVMRSPMDRPEAPVVEQGAAAPRTTPKAAPSGPVSPVITNASPEQLVVGGMLVGGNVENGLASINHRVYRLGDLVTPHWRITGIDTRKRVVTLEGPDGRTVGLSPPTPSAEREW